MATSVLTGRQVACTYKTVNYDDQITSATVTLDDPNGTVQTLNGLVDYVIDKEVGTVTLEILQDWGVAAGFCDILWTDADTAPTTAVAMTLTINTKVMTLSVIPKRPDFGGAAPDALTVSVTMPIRSVSIA
jgi:hypothetical protein